MDSVNKLIFLTDNFIHYIQFYYLLLQLKALAIEHLEDADSFLPAISTTKDNIKWLENTIDDISSWLQTRVSSGSTTYGVNIVLTVLLSIMVMQ